MAECQRKMTQLTDERDSLVKQANSAKRYLDSLPSAEEHAANLQLVNTPDCVNVCLAQQTSPVPRFGCWHVGLFIDLFANASSVDSYENH